jgi:anaerobic carbon-monoxide dehydrogenase iron sulfur subunit
MEKQETVKIVTLYPEKCSGCNSCEKACSKIHFKTDEGGERSALRIEKRDGKFEINVCNQCGLCIDMCSVGALSRNAKGVVVLDQKLCVGCQVCVAFCPSAAMRKAKGRIEPFKCISCGSCVHACSENALELIDKKVDNLKAVVYHRLGV